MARKKLLKGNSHDIVAANTKMLKEAGYSHARALRCALCHANKKHDKHVKSIGKKITKNNPQVTISDSQDARDEGFDDR